MLCGASLKRSLELEALLCPPSGKRRRCSPLIGAATTPSPQRCSLRPWTESLGVSLSGEHRLSPEQIFQNIRKEDSRYQQRRKLEGAFKQTETETSSDPGSSSGASSLKKNQATFTLRQVNYLCEHLLKDQEEKIRVEYEQILNTKLAEQYESFVKFTQDQIMMWHGARPASYIS